MFSFTFSPTSRIWFYEDHVETVKCLILFLCHFPVAFLDSILLFQRNYTVNQFHFS